MRWNTSANTTTTLANTGTARFGFGKHLARKVVVGTPSTRHNGKSSLGDFVGERKTVTRGFRFRVRGRNSLSFPRRHFVNDMHDAREQEATLTGVGCWQYLKQAWIFRDERT
jgi:hypothetical protein